MYDKVYEFDPESEKELIALMRAVYQSVVSLDFMGEPDVFMAANKKFGIKEIKNFVALLLAKYPK